MPPSARICDTIDRGPVLVVTTIGAIASDPARVRALTDRGVTLLAREDTHALATAVPALLQHGVTSLLLEGGAALHAAAWSAGVVDRVRCYVTPAVLGAAGLPWAMPSTFGLAALGPTRAGPLGNDGMVEADVHRTH